MQIHRCALQLMQEPTWSKCHVFNCKPCETNGAHYLQSCRQYGKGGKSFLTSYFYAFKCLHPQPYVFLFANIK